MNKSAWGLILPVLVTGVAFVGAEGAPLRIPVKRGMELGLIVALVQAGLSVGAMKWAWQKPFFYWVWGSGLLVRLLILAGTAVVVYRHTSFNLAATLLTLVLATTVFMITEASFFLKDS